MHRKWTDNPHLKPHLLLRASFPSAPSSPIQHMALVIPERFPATRFYHASPARHSQAHCFGHKHSTFSRPLQRKPTLGNRSRAAQRKPYDWVVVVVVVEHVWDWNCGLYMPMGMPIGCCITGIPPICIPGIIIGCCICMPGIIMGAPP